MIKPTQKQCKYCKEKKLLGEFYEYNLARCKQCIKNIDRTKKMLCQKCNSNKSIIINSRSSFK